jgi:hypothetical protein
MPPTIPQRGGPSGRKGVAGKTLGGKTGAKRHRHVAFSSTFDAVGLLRQYVNEQENY